MGVLNNANWCNVSCRRVSTKDNWRYGYSNPINVDNINKRACNTKTECIFASAKIAADNPSAQACMIRIESGDESELVTGGVIVKDITTDSENTLAAITLPMQGRISSVHHLGRQFLFAMSLEARGREYNAYYACDFDKRTRQFQACKQVLGDVSFYYMEFIIFQNHFVTIESATLTPKINVYDLNNGRLLPNTAPHVVNLSGDSYAVTLSFQWTYESDVLQFTYSTVIKPPTLYTYPMKTKIPVTSYLSPIP
ncbi:hypothetical protein BDF22DRAFT_777868 [Syncephalis plumigaleata]|nr:hypothetical protein BDF22DRAFT_777868 [Syncephalis plumigaleata]